MCLWPGTWLVLLGASQSSVWLQQLANTLVPGAFNALRDNFVTDGRVGGSGRGRFSSRWSWFRKNLLDKHWKKDVWKQPHFAGCHYHCHPRHGWREHKLSARKGVYLQLMDLILEDGKIVCGPCRFSCQLR